MPLRQFSDSGLTVLRRAGELARRSGAVNPAHLLAAVLEVSGPLGEMAAVAHTPPAPKSRSDGQPAVVHYDRLARQAIASAAAWANRRGALAGPEDLLIVLVDQHSPSVVAALARMGPDSDRLRQAALRMLGLPAEYGPVAIEPVPPAESTDVLVLDIEELPADAWAVLQDRQARLPLQRVRRPSDWAAITTNEQRAVLKMGARRGLSEHETHSLLHHHLRAVERHGAEAAPGIVGDPRSHRPGGGALALKVAWFRWTAQRY